ncbi:hypothetical protein [Falsiroseomonas sp. HW251]|uniref:hypothetical protein n=1 Tax=Falsiroseomonas sp. HW251 TaxID=3390998 RepID=UPI003D31DCAC
MSGFDAAAVAGWIAEATETGNPLAVLEPPRDADEAAEIAAAALEAMGQVACGVRVLARGGAMIAGPMTEARLVPAGAPIATDALRHAEVTAAAIGVLAEPLDPDDDAAAVFARIHPALDVSAMRYGERVEDPLLLAADLGRLGLVVAGKGRAVAAGATRVALGAKGARGAECDLGARFAEAARFARDWGGLPAGALLVVAGLTPAAAPAGTLRASLSGIGSVETSFTAE